MVEEEPSRFLDFFDCCISGGSEGFAYAGLTFSGTGAGPWQMGDGEAVIGKVRDKKRVREKRELSSLIQVSVTSHDQ